MNIPISPKSELRARVIYVFTRNAMRIPVMTGMISIQGVMLNDDCSAVIISSDCEALLVLENNPTQAYVINARIIAGEEVSIRYLMCVNSSTLHEDEARIVVSDRGDTLSPK